LALLAQRARIGSSESPAAVDVLEMATIGGARALGLDNVIGTLEPGKQADLAAFGLDRVGPTFDPVTAAVFSIGGAAARFVAVAGTPLVRDGSLLRARDGLADRIDTFAEALAGWLASGGEMEGRG
jgi:5-methylthioadenosine/S-adenosylhomocysteine deaminase